MRKFIQSRSTWEIAMVSVLSLFATVGVVMAATTIGTNVTTGGNIYATSTLYVDGASTFTNTVTMSAANLKVSTGYGLDTAAASGVLNIGTTSATTINIGSAGATVAIKGNMTFPTAYGLDSTGDVLNIGTTTATTINIGSLTGITAAGGRITVPAAYGLDVATAGVLNIGTSTANAINIAKLTVVTAFGGNMTVPNGYGLDAVSGALNIGTTTATQVNIGSVTAPVVMTNSSSTLASFNNASSTVARFGGGTAVSGLLFGTCAVDPQSIEVATSSLVSTSCNTNNSNLTSAYTVFMTPPTAMQTDYSLIYEGATASTTAGYIEILLYNASTTAAVDGASRTWKWMAIR